MPAQDNPPVPPVNLERVAKAYQAGCEAASFAGVVELFDFNANQAIFSRCEGLANRSDALRNQANTRFATASGSKIFTAVATLQLVEQGEIGLDTPVRDVLGEDFPFGADVTVEHLLTHTSGIPDYFDETDDDDDEAEESTGPWEHTPVYTLRSGKDFLPLFCKKAPLFAPGSRFGYNNAGFVLLGMIVERLAGLPFGEAVQQGVFIRAGMRDAGYFQMDSLPARTALGYVEDEHGWRSNIFLVPFVGGGDGGAFATSADWVAFWRALMGYRLLGAEMTEKMLGSRVPTGHGDSSFYGLGVWIHAAPGILAYSVVGEDPGVQMVSSYYPERGLGLTILSNQSGPAWKMRADMQRVIFSAREE